MKILVVDDNEIILNVVSDVLRADGYSVVSVNNAPEALKKLKQKDYELLITDIKMPFMTGIEIIKKLPQISPHTKVIIITGCTELDLAQDAIRQGVYEYLLKPFNNDTLRLAVKNAIKRKKEEEEAARLKELFGLFRVSEFITSSYTSKKLLELILSYIIKQLNASQGSIMLLNRETETLFIAASVGLDEEIVKNTNIKVGEGIAGRVFKDGMPVLVTNIEEHPLFSEIARGYPDKSFVSYAIKSNEEIISFPLATAKKVLGVINVRKKTDNTSFTQADMELISILSTQAAVAIENNQLLDNLNNVYIEIMQFIVALTEARDVYLKGHTQRVTEWCLKLGEELRLEKEELEVLRYAATLHDIGKLAVNELILNKPVKFTPEEYEMIKTHSIIGANILKPLNFLSRSRDIVLHHHERIDGKGYPDGLCGKELSLSMNIIILADSYDAMHSNRAYRAALPEEEIKNEISKNINKQFDPVVVDAFFKLLEKQKKEKAE
ncbi:MAG: response regulator [bacterium]|nr:response regulator [bacterium]